MLRWMLAVMGACATLGPGTALAQVSTVADALKALEAADDAENGSPPRAVPIGNMAQWVRFEDYPPQALREELSGMSRVRLYLDAQGIPTRCSIAATSGSDALDSTACAKLMERARFRPAMNSAGVAIPAVFETSILWSMPHAAPPNALLSGPLPAPDPNAPIPQPVEMRSWFRIADLQFDPAVPGDRTVMYFLDVDGAGRATDCTITRGSGDELFDASLCRQLELNAEFEVSSNVSGRFVSGLSLPPEAVLALANRSPSRRYAISAFIEEDGSVSACRWVGTDSPALDPWTFCNKASWVDQRNVDGELVRGEVELEVSQRWLDEVARPQ